MSKVTPLDAAPSTDSSKNASVDKNLGIEEVTEPVDQEEGIIIDNGLRRGLEGRHVSLISLASIIGASCFYGFGYALYLSGPLGALIGFGIIGTCSLSS
jgi:amino acid transporter